MNKIALFLIALYQKIISPALPDSCRFYPSCSEYSKQAFQTYNFLTALSLSANRIGRCNPMSEGYFDPLPEKNIKGKQQNGRKTK